MKPIPLLDYVGTPLFVALLVLLFWMQWKLPLRRFVRNYLFSAPGFAIIRLAMIPIPLAVSVWAAQRGFGLFHWLRMPAWLAGLAGFLVMDWAYYWWHYANHMVPFFWRFHNVHHTDLDLDVSTAARFHFGEIIFSVPFRVVVVALCGVPLLALLIFELVFESATLFQHSNWRLPLRLERALNHIIVTPRMHGIHHSIVQRETNSNWGTIFCCWDKLHCSLRRDIPQDAISIGVAAYRDEGELTIGKLLAMPLRNSGRGNCRAAKCQCASPSPPTNYSRSGRNHSGTALNFSSNGTGTANLAVSKDGNGTPILYPVDISSQGEIRRDLVIAGPATVTVTTSNQPLLVTYRLDPNQ